MTSAENYRVLKNNRLSSALQEEDQTVTKTFLSEFSADDIKDALLPDIHDLVIPVQELIATGEAAFAFIRYSEIEPNIKNAFGQLEKQFEFYKNLVAKS